METKHNQRMIYPVLSILIPCILGIIGMISKGVSVTIWMRNLIVIMSVPFLSRVVLKHNLKFPYRMIVLAAALLLGFTFLGPDIDGVHRWLKLPLFAFNISAIVIPITMVAFHRLIEEKQFAVSVTGILIIACLLYLQPDASQLLAFALPMIVLLLKAAVPWIIKGGSSVMLLFLTWKSWNCLDTLQPVEYTEGIFTMLLDLSAVLYGVGIAALLFIPVYFLISCRKENRSICAGMAMYHWLVILSTLMGNFPVPFMGYGISPILGFTIFLIWFIHEEKKRG